MKPIEQIKLSWPFLITAVVYVLLVIISTSGIVTVPGFYFGIIHILLAVTITYTCFKAGKNIHDKGRYWRSALMVYGGGLLSASFLIHAINLLF